MLLLHGYPQTHAIWHRVAPALAVRFNVVASDLRGYGDSGKPPTDGQHAPYSKRAMARDQVELMRALGHERFFVVGHDRGGRVAHRLAVDHPDAVMRIAVLDIAPTLAMYEKTDDAFARAYWHWFFLIQPAFVPERMIGGDPRFYLRAKMAESYDRGVFDPEAWGEYERCFTPGAVHASCEDYRAAATIDLEHDRADLAAGRRVRAPLLALWGAHGVVERCFDTLDEWRRVADDVRGRALPSGHYIPEEVPELLIRELEKFFDE
ncbi:MAG TPA: alpha/beta hydrolase [Usitatibacter sp.]|nr:alpha/beta hydrolase [Usitatibacter sp.]